MHYELEALTRQGMEDKIKELEITLKAIEYDFALCAKSLSPCLFCIKKDNCLSPYETCNFVWKKHT